MNLNQLKVLGLSEGSIKVYKAILTTGLTSINQIHEKTGLQRRGIYDILNRLIEKGLVSYTTEKGKKMYKCAPLNKLKAALNTKKKEVQDCESTIKEIEKTYKVNQPQISLEAFRGKQGIKSVFEDILNYKKAYFIGGGWYVVKEMPFFWPTYNKRRLNKKVQFYNLVRHDLEQKDIGDKKFTHIKTLPKELSGSPMVIFIYGDKVANVVWGNEQFAFVVQSKEVAENYKKYHKYLWEKVAKA